MQVTVVTPKFDLFDRAGERLGELVHRLAGRPLGRSTVGSGFAAYQRDRAYSASFTGSPMLPMRYHVEAQGWSA